MFRVLHFDLIFNYIPIRYKYGQYKRKANLGEMEAQNQWK